ncbi:MAG: homoserine kinase [Armatimonadia bacterium]
MEQVTVWAPATIANLGPGFDTLGMALSLYNVVELAFADTTTVEIEGEGADTLPRDDTHLILSSAAALAREAGMEVPGWRLRQVNNIPLARGLGSSSAAIVGGLVAANELLDLGASAEELLQLGASIEGHPDNVAPAIYGGLTVCCGSEEMCCLPLPAPEILVVVAIPDFEISTEAARKVMPASIPHADGVYNAAHAAMTLAALTSGRLEYLSCGMRDRLHQPYRAHLVPGFEQVQEAALRSGAYSACLSGSGPTIAAFADHYENDIAAVMCQAFLEAGVQARSLVLRPDEDGARVICNT